MKRADGRLNAGWAAGRYIIEPDELRLSRAAMCDDGSVTINDIGIPEPIFSLDGPLLRRMS